MDIREVHRATVKVPLEYGYLVSAVEQQQVAKCDRGERDLLQQEGQLLKALRRLLIHVHQRLVVQGHWVQLLSIHTDMFYLTHTHYIHNTYTCLHACSTGVSKGWQRMTCHVVG